MATRYPGPVIGPNRYNVRDFTGTGLNKKLGRRSWEDQQVDSFTGSGMADKLAGKYIKPTVTNPADNTASGINWGKVAGDAQKGLDRVTPYLSNVANALRKPPRPVMGKAIDRVSLGRVSNAAELNDIDSGTRAANLAVDNAVDSQTASAIKGANLAQGFMAKNRSNAQNTQVNTGIANQEAGMNLNVDAQNAAKVDQYNQEKIGAQMAYQREQSQNLANFSDKRMAEINANDARQLDEKKFNILSKVYSNGITDRLLRKVINKPTGDLTEEDVANGIGTSMNAFGGKLRKVSALYDSPMVKETEAMFADGGTLGGPGKGTYQTQAEVDKANLFAKDFSARRNYINPGESYVAKKPGDPVVQFTNLETGKPYQGEYSKMPASRLVPMPDDVKDIYWDKSYNQPYYKDGEDMKYVDTKWWNHPRFTQSREAQEKNNAVLASRAGSPVAMHQLGGPLVSFPKMRGKLRKIV